MMSEMPEEDLPPEVGIDPAVEFDEDGGLTLQLEPDQPEEEFSSREFDANLAEELDEYERIQLGEKLKELINVDLRSRSDWEQRMLKGLTVIGMQDVGRDEVAFLGAAEVTYPALAEAMIRFQANAMEELMPPEGPVKAGVVGKQTEARTARAERVQDYLNYTLMVEDDEYYWEADTKYLYLSYAGSFFQKVAPDPIIGRTRSRWIPASDFIVPAWASCLQTAPRYTHRYSMSENTFLRAVDSGFFCEADFSSNSAEGEAHDLQSELGDKADEKTREYHEDDRDLQFYEITIDWDFAWDKYAKGKSYSLPYTITFEWETGKVVRIARCWAEEDPRCTKQVWFIHYKFLPGLGFYGWGYLHVIGGLGKAASGALRLLLDGSMTASLQGGFKARDSKIAGTVEFTPGTWVDVDMTAEDLAKQFYTPPWKEPSPALFSTLEILINSLQRFASTTESMVGDAPANQPVGTTVALIEQGSKIYTGIHRRCHHAQGQEFRLIAKCEYLYMEGDSYPYEVDGEQQEIMRDDFGPPVDVIPVSDPNVFSSVQRIAQAQAGVQLVDSRPDLYPQAAARKAHRAMWRALKVPDWESYLPERTTKRLDPVSENVAAMGGHGIEVFPEQDHEAHLAVHQAFEQEVMGMDPEIQQRIIPILKAHKAAHFAAAYRLRLQADMIARTGVPLPPFDPNNFDEAEELPPELEAAVARAAAEYAPPPPPPMANPEEEAADVAMAREQDRKDVAAAREEARKDFKQRSELKREGFISDVEDPELSPEGAV